MGGWGEGLNPGCGPERESERLNPGESGSNLEDVDGIVVIATPHYRDNPERFVVCPEVWIAC